MKKILYLLSMGLLCLFVIIALSISGLFRLFWDWFIASFDVWILRISRCGVFLFALLVAFMGASFMYQSTNSPDQATVIVICIIGLFMVFAAVAFAVKFMPRGVREQHYNPYAQ